MQTVNNSFGATYNKNRHLKISKGKHLMCVASLRSMTHAVKAKKALADFLIDSEIVKLEPYMTEKGCAYGIKFDCVNLYQAEDALKQKSVKYTEIIRL